MTPYKSFPILTAATLLGMLFAFVVQVLVVNYLDQNQVGTFAAIISVGNVIASLVGFGLNGFLVKEFGARGSAAKNSLDASRIYFILGAIISSLLVLFYNFPSTSTELNISHKFWIIGHVLGLGSISIIWAFAQISGRVLLQSIWQIMPHFIRLCFILVLGLLLASHKITINHVLIGFGTVGYLFFFYTLYAFSRFNPTDGSSLEQCDQFSTQKTGSNNFITIFRGAVPFGATAIAYMIYLQSIILVMPYFSDSKQVADYFVAFSFFLISVAVITGVTQKLLLMRMHRFNARSFLDLRKEIKNLIVPFLAISFLCSVLLFSVSEYVIIIFYGESYLNAAYSIQILSVATFIRILGLPFDLYMTTNGLITRKSAAYAFCSIVILLVFLIEKSNLGSIQASLLFLTTEVLVFLSFLYSSRIVILPVKIIS